MVIHFPGRKYSFEGRSAFIDISVVFSEISSILVEEVREMMDIIMFHVEEI